MILYNKYAVNTVVEFKYIHASSLGMECYTVSIWKHTDGYFSFIYFLICCCSDDLLIMLNILRMEYILKSHILLLLYHFYLEKMEPYYTYISLLSSSFIKY